MVACSLCHGAEAAKWKGSAILGSVAVPVLLKHIESLRRIAEGKEFKIDFLWDKEGELERTGWVEEE